jgi:hypothetical protein
MHREETAITFRRNISSPVRTAACRLAGGPAHRRQAMVIDVNYAEFPYDTATFTGSVEAGPERQRGSNAGVDLQWMFNPNLGVGTPRS